jgi:hypothetical protein
MRLGPAPTTVTTFTTHCAGSYGNTDRVATFDVNDPDIWNLVTDLSRYVRYIICSTAATAAAVTPSATVAASTPVVYTNAPAKTPVIRVLHSKQNNYSSQASGARMDARTIETPAANIWPHHHQIKILPEGSSTLLPPPSVPVALVNAAPLPTTARGMMILPVSTKVANGNAPPTDGQMMRPTTLVSPQSNSKNNMFVRVASIEALQCTIIPPPPTTPIIPYNDRPGLAILADDTAKTAFKEMFAPLIEKEFEYCGVQADDAAAIIWHEHQRQFGPGCNNCFMHLGNLAEAVPKGRTIFGSGNSNNLLSCFVPRFFPLVAQEYPNESGWNLAIRLARMWNKHEFAATQQIPGSTEHPCWCA